MKPEVGHGARKFTQEFKMEAVQLILERGVMVAQASRDFGGSWLGVAPMGAGVCRAMRRRPFHARGR